MRIRCSTNSSTTHLFSARGTSKCLKGLVLGSNQRRAFYESTVPREAIRQFVGILYWLVFFRLIASRWGDDPYKGRHRRGCDMTYIVLAEWTAREGHQDVVAAAIEKLVEPSRREPGCLRYLPHRRVDDDRVFLLYEEYVDEASYRAHTESDHFARYALGEGIPHLEARDRKFLMPREIGR